MVCLTKFARIRPEKCDFYSVHDGLLWWVSNYTPAKRSENETNLMARTVPERVPKHEVTPCGKRCPMDKPLPDTFLKEMWGRKKEKKKEKKFRTWPAPKPPVKPPQEKPLPPMPRYNWFDPNYAYFNEDSLDAPVVPILQDVDPTEMKNDKDNKHVEQAVENYGPPKIGKLDLNRKKLLDKSLKGLAKSNDGSKSPKSLNSLTSISNVTKSSNKLIDEEILDFNG